MLSRRTLLISAAAAHGALSKVQANAGWQKMADMPVVRSETPAIAFKGNIYVAGGFDAGARTDRYDPATDSWSRLADLPTSTNHPGIAVWNDQIVLAGGYTSDGSGAIKDIWVYSDGDDIWTTIGELPAAMGAFGLATLEQDLYLAGGALGHLGGEATASVWKKSSIELDWQECAPLSKPREHLAVVAHGGHIFAIGGRAHGYDSDELGGAVERYDVVRDRWEELATLPEPRSGLAGTAVPGGVVVAGGETSTAVFNNVHLLSDSATSWDSLPLLPIELHGAGLAYDDHYLYAIGGSRIAGQVASVSTVYRLDVNV